MRVFIYMMVLVSVSFFCAMTLTAEYYQYTDEEGNLHFTDNPAEIPLDQTDKLKIHQSLKDETAPGSYGDTRDSDASLSGGNQAKADAESQSESTQASSTWDGVIRARAETLNKEKAKLDRRFIQLQDEKRQLDKMNSDDMNSDERSEHKDQIHELNERIRSYEKQRQEFQEEVEKFNKNLKQ